MTKKPSQKTKWPGTAHPGMMGDGTVVPKPVETGDLRGGLRVIQAGLDKDDRVIIDGVVHAVPGNKVEAQDGTIQYDETADTHR